MIVIYSRAKCSYCERFNAASDVSRREAQRAKALLNQHGLQYREHIITPDNRDDMIALMLRVTNIMPLTLPVVIIDGEYIGGYNELSKRLSF